MISYKQHLQEKLLLINKGASEGQVVFLAGGAGSGKGFAISHFLEGNKFKIINVDDWKTMYLKMPQKYPELKGLDLRKPSDVATLHYFVKDKGITPSKAAMSLVRDTSHFLPNIMFDVTLKASKELYDIVPALEARGYKKENIHIVWVLTQYDVAVKQNANRSRIVPADILLQTHEGAANTMHGMIYQGKYPSKLIGGGVWVILNGPKHTVLWNPDTAGKTGNFVIKDFKYLTVKEPGKKIVKGSVTKQLFDWIKGNIPNSSKTADIFNEETICEGPLQDLIRKHSDPYAFAEEAMKQIRAGELTLKERGASNARELVALYYKHSKKSA